jgi:alanine dehydrogenase
MIVGVLKEIKAEENRVALTPAGVEILRQHGHTVMVERSAGSGSGFVESAYTAAGAEIVDEAREVYARAEMILRVKEPQPSEFKLLRPGQIYFSFLHLAANEGLTRALREAGTVALAYETIQCADGSLPLLTPMSEVAGPMAIQEGAKYLEMAQGGHGTLLGGVPGVDPATVLILGGGVVGANAAKIACGLGAKVYLLDNDLDRLRYLSDVMPSNCFVLMSSPAAVRERIRTADLVVGAVLIPGRKSPKLVTRAMLDNMKPGAVLVDVAIDQGGCFETSRETTHSRPTYSVAGIIHYAVSNMPGAVPKTATMALTNASLPYVLQIAGQGWPRAAVENPEIKQGANVVQGRITYRGVAEALGLAYTPFEKSI